VADSRAPIYQRLADELFAAIRAGAYPPGTKIPSEHELADSHGASRPTVRQATDVLIARGVLVRKRGSGTFVRSVPTQVDLFSLGGTMVSFEAGGIAVETELLGVPERLAIHDASHPFVGREVIRIARVASSAGTPVLFEELDFDAAYFEGLADVDLAKRSISDVIARRFQARAIGADQSFRVERLHARDAAPLGLAPRTPVLRVDRTLHFDRFESAAHVRMLCPNGPFVFSQRIGGNHA